MTSSWWLGFGALAGCAEGRKDWDASEANAPENERPELSELCGPIEVVGPPAASPSLYLEVAAPDSRDGRTACDAPGGLVTGWYRGFAVDSLGDF